MWYTAQDARKSAVIKSWKSVTFEDCPDCSGEIMILSESDNDSFYDGDLCECQFCGLTGQFDCEDGSISWHI